MFLPSTQLILSPQHLIPALWGPFTACPYSDHPALPCPCVAHNSGCPPGRCLLQPPSPPSSQPAWRLSLTQWGFCPSQSCCGKSLQRPCPGCALAFPDFCASGPPVATHPSGNSVVGFQDPSLSLFPRNPLSCPALAANCRVPMAWAPAFSFIRCQRHASQKLVHLL